MSKKIMKRSLVLSAMMAFVITGSAWAEVINLEADGTRGPIQHFEGQGLDCNLNDYKLTIEAPSSNGIWVNGYTYNIYGSDKSTLEINSGAVGLAAHGSVDVGTLDITSNGYAIQSYAGNTTIKADVIKLKSYTAGLNVIGDYADQVLTVDVDFDNSLTITGIDGGAGIESYNHSGTVSVNGAEGSTLTIDTTGWAVYAGSNSKVYVNTKLDDNNQLVYSGGDTTTIKGYIGAVDTSEINVGLKGAGSTYTGRVQTGENATTNFILNDGATWNVTGESKVSRLDANEGKIVFTNDDAKIYVDSGSASLNLTMAGKTSDELNTAQQLTTVAEKLSVKQAIKDAVKATVVMPEGAVKGEATGDVVFKTVDGEYLGGVVETASVTEKVNTTNASISDLYSVGLMAWRAENNDMHKRLGELRDANGEHGAWVRMTRGESEYESVKNQYNSYQMGYDQKAGGWTVGAAVTYTEGESSFAKGSGENDHTGFAVYGSKLNNDGTYIDLIAKYAKLDHEYTVSDGIGSGEYDTDGLALSAEYGKRFEKGNGLWIEPQVELTYGQVDSVDYEAENGTVSLDNMNSLVGRVGFRAGKDIKDGNVYVRASYLYDFEGETDISFSDGVDTRRFEQDLGGGWYEIGLGANINLSKATYIYADVEHACGGEVDTDWKWNLGVRYSF